jgi:NO-binding membrane sensor protein with MHYT domain
VAEVHHFTYGAFNPIAAFVLAFLGSFFGLLCTERAQATRTRARRNRWLIIASFSIGGAAIWLMHFVAMVGFDVPASPVRYDAWLTIASLVIALATVGAGVIVVGQGPATPTRLLGGGVLTGLGVLAMHYVGLAGMHVAGDVHYDPAMVAVSTLIAVVAGTATLWFTVHVRGWLKISGAATIMAVAVCAMHYTGMAAMSVHIDPQMIAPVEGIRPLLMVVPITLITSALLLGVALSALQAMTEEEFTNGAGVPRRGVHAEAPWSLKQASMTAIRARTPGPRPSPSPSPRPLPARQPIAAGSAGADA